MRVESWFRFLFIVYCLEAGLFLCFAPWSDAWERIVLMVPFVPVRLVLGFSWARGFVTGFGLVHLVWAAHDVDLVLRPPPSPPRSGPFERSGPSEPAEPAENGDPEPLGGH